jgi:putative membrane-bound dehydrogenase-like protein
MSLASARPAETAGPTFPRGFNRSPFSLWIQEFAFEWGHLGSGLDVSIPFMKKLFLLLVLAGVSLAARGAEEGKPLRIFIRANTKTHGPGQHDHPRFLKDWVPLLNERGAKATGKIGFPTAEELEATDVLVFYSQDAGTIKPEDRANLDKFLKRGGGIVAIHDSVVGNDPHWFKTIIGGAWENGHSKWHEGEVGEYFVDTEHPITRGISNFDFKDEVYWDLHMMPEAHVLATSFETPFLIAPQMWTYEKENYRAFVFIPGHEYVSFNLPHFRTLLLRGIAWAGKRADVDYLCTKEELASLRYPPGGPTAPEKAASKLTVHPEFDVSLVASEPLIEKVISMDWDEKGRLWVAETPEYPNGRLINVNDAPIKASKEVEGRTLEDRPAKDRISWLEDTDGDGRMDKKHVFADGLELVTSLVFYKDGVIVEQAPDILWLRDTNGDGKCDMQDEKVVLFTGFGTSDTHAVINNMRRGMDGWVYSAIGYSAGNPRSPQGKDFGRITAGVFRFKPDGSAIEQVAAGSCNTWGFDFAADNEMFYTTATCGEHFLHIVMPEKAIARGALSGVRSSAVVPDHQKIFPAVHPTRAPYVQIDWVGAFTAEAGCCVYTGGAWPAKFNNWAFSGEATMCLLHNEVLKPNGSTYTATKEAGREETEFIAGSDLWFRPIHSRVGPDGALYVVDFYNQAAVHNDTRGPKHGAHNAAVRPDRDHHLGRIWRVQHKEAKSTRAPELASAEHKDWVAALNHPNGWARMTAMRLLLDHGAVETAPALQKLVKEGKGYAPIHALWLLNDFGKLDAATLVAAVDSGDAAVRKNGLRALAENDSLKGKEAREAALRALTDLDARTQMNALLALANLTDAQDMNGTLQIAEALVAAYPKLGDEYLRSAAVGIASKDPGMFFAVAMQSKDPAMVVGLINETTRMLARRADAASAALFVKNLAAGGAQTDGVKLIALETFAATYQGEAEWSPELKAAFENLLKSNRAGLVAATLPLAARWDKEGALSNEMRAIIAPLLVKVNDRTLSDDERGQLAVSLIGVRKIDPAVVKAVAGVLGSTSSPALQKRVLEALGSAGDAGVATQLIAAYPKLPSDLRDAALGQITKRSESALAFLDAVEQKKIDLGAVGPVGTHRLRTHPEKAVADRANAVIDAIRGPEMKEKDALIAQFKGAVEETPNVEKGKLLFTQNCATCHRFKGEGRDVAPDLTGMGAHGLQDLLVHILDPNRVVEPNFITVSIETKDDLSYDGIVARENKSSIVLRNATADVEVQQSNIKSRRSTGLSLMPNGFEALGKESLRDLIGYLCADEKRFRILDLRQAFTADSTKGLFITRDNTNDTIHFRKFGPVKVGEVPFDIINPVVSPSGNNLVLLRGGSGNAKTMPQKVEVQANVKANILHFLGGVAGWGFPCCGENKDLPAAKVTVHFADGQSEEIVMKNGVEFADHVSKIDVPGSKDASELVRRGQIRTITKRLRHDGVIQSLTLESFDNTVAPVFAAITVEQAQRATTRTAAASGAPADGVTTGSATASGVSGDVLKITAKTLIVGGGSSHNFDRWFNKEDRATLAKAFIDVQYTDQVNLIAPVLDKLEVLYLCTNQQLTNKAVRDGIMARAAAGKGILLVHPALWYNWADWPEYNQKLVGGGARSHDKFGEFEVTVIDEAHPIMKGVPQTFKISDELYHFQKDVTGPPIKVLAIGKNIETGKTYPVVWTTQAPNARIVCITLGHDDKSHQLLAFQTLLVNAHEWARGGVK